MPARKTGLAAAGPVQIKAPFGSVNRQRLIQDFLKTAQGPAGLDVYRMLLWTDKSTGLAHCYESDKCQPGKPWHQRALRFHDWVASQIGVAPRDVAAEIDWLFRHTAADYAQYMVQQYQVLLRRAAVQRQPFAGRDFPEPGEDPEIVEIIRDVLGAHLSAEPSADDWRTITQRIRNLVGVENKRKNLVGEGFEDVLEAVLNKFDSGRALQVWARSLLHLVPGFANRVTGGKPNKVDLAVTNRRTGRRTIVTAKWSIRADREKQFPAEFASYVAARSDHHPFDYALITNEFDPARLVRACEFAASNSALFTTVVHLMPEALEAVYGASPEPTMKKVLHYVQTGRILGTDDWFAGLVKG